MVRVIPGRAERGARRSTVMVGALKPRSPQFQCAGSNLKAWLGVECLPTLKGCLTWSEVRSTVSMAFEIQQGL